MSTKRKLPRAYHLASAFNTAYSVGDNLVIRDGYGIIFQAQLAQPAVVLGDEAVVFVMERPECYPVRQVFSDARLK